MNSASSFNPYAMKGRKEIELARENNRMQASSIVASFFWHIMQLQINQINFEHYVK